MRLRHLVILAALAAALPACSSGRPVHGQADLRVAERDGQKVVVTGSGLTVYVYLPDPTSPPSSSCTGDCANDWPPVGPTGPLPELEGVPAAKVGVIRRPDGSRQLTLAGYPLYRFAGDRAPGEYRGETVGQQWFAVDPTGNFASLPPSTFHGGPGTAAVTVGRAGSVPSLTTGTGQTVYAYRDDTPTAIACTPSWCEQDWPPVIVTALPASPSGVTARLTLVHRPDGTQQLAADGHPLYRFAGDQQPGEATGSGIGRDWYPVPPDGAVTFPAGG